MGLWRWCGWLVVAASVAWAAPGDALWRQALDYQAERTWDRAAQTLSQFLTEHPQDPRAPEAGLWRLRLLEKLPGEEAREVCARETAAYVERWRGTVWELRGRRRELETRSPGRTWRERYERWQALVTRCRELLDGRADDPCRRELAEALLGAAAQARRSGNRTEPADAGRACLIAAAELAVDTELTARAWQSLAELAKSRSWAEKAPREQLLAEAEGWWLRIVRETPTATLAGLAWQRLAENAAESGDYLLARARYYEVVRRDPRGRLAAEARATLATIEHHEIGLSADGCQPSGTNLRCRLSGRNEARAEVTVYRVDQAGIKPGGPNDERWVAKRLAAQHLRRLGEQSVAAPPVKPFAPWQLPYEVAVPGPGVYLLEARRPDDASGKSRSRALVYCGDLVLLQSYDYRELVTQVLDRRTWLPAAAVKVTTTVTPEKGMAQVLSGVTGPDGLWRVAARVPQDDTVFTLARRGPELAVLEEPYLDGGLWQSEPAEPDEVSGSLLTERALYRPGQTVHFAGILRRWSPATATAAGAWQVAAGQAFEVAISAPQRGVVWQGRLSTDAAGILHGSWDVPLDAELGAYGIAARAGEDQVASGPFTVEEYRKPDLSVDVQAPRDNVVPGQAATVIVRARYYSGAPAARAKLAYSVTRDYFSPEPAPNSRATRWRWQPRKGADHWRPHEYEDGLRAEAVTDAQGEARLTVPTVADGKDHWYGVSVSLTDLSRRTEHGWGGFVSSSATCHLWTGVERVVYAPGETVRVAWRAQDPAGQPLGARARATLFRLRFVPGRPKDARARDLPRFEREKTEWADRPVETTADGEGLFTFPAPDTGCFQVVLTGESTGGRRPPVTAEAFWSAAPLGDHGHPFRALHVVADRQAYSVGDMARVLVFCPVRGARLLVRRCGPREVTPLEPLTLQGDQASLTFRLDDAPGDTVQVIGLLPTGLAEAQCSLPVSKPVATITTSLSSDAATYPARGRGRLTLRTTDASGRPVSARVVAAVTDESAHALARDYHGPGLDPTVLASEYGEMMFPPRGTGTEATPYAGATDQPQGSGHQWRALESVVVEGRLVTRGQEGDDAMHAEQAPGAFIDHLSNGYGSHGPHAVVREDFPDTMLWAPTVVTDADGRAELPLVFPDSLTTWRATALAIGGPTTFGAGTCTFRSTKDLLVRLIAPAALTQRDEATIGAVVTNAGARPVSARVTLAADSGEWLGAPAGQVSVAAGGSARFECPLRAAAGERVALTATVDGGEQSDAMRLRLPVVAHGIARLDHQTVGTGADGRATVALTLPPTHQPGSGKLTVHVSTSRAGALLDALAWAQPETGLRDTDRWTRVCQRFADALRARVEQYAGPAPDSPPPPQAGHPRRGVLAGGADEGPDPLADELTADGGLGWFPQMPSDPALSAFLAETGLRLPASSGLLVGRHGTDGGPPSPTPPGAVDRPERGRLVAYLERWLRRQREASDTVAHAALVVDEVLRRRLYAPAREEGAISAAAVELLWAGRGRLTDEGRARLVLLLARRRDERAAVAWRNLLAHRVESGQGLSWGWDHDPVTATALGLDAALAMEQGGPTAAKAATWLLTNRRGSRWHHLVATARAVAALADYSALQRETASEARLELLLNGRPLRTWQVSRAQALRWTGQVELAEGELAPGSNTLTLARAGQGQAWLAGDLRWITDDEPIRAAGERLTLARTYHLVDGERRTPCAPGQSVPSGALVEVQLRLKAQVPLDCVALTDPTPAGCRAVDEASGTFYADLWCYRQVRERATELFIHHLPQGTNTLRYRLRAEAPGRYHALPAQVHATLLPSIAAVSDEALFVVGEG